MASERTVSVSSHKPRWKPQEKDDYNVLINRLRQWNPHREVLVAATKNQSDTRIEKRQRQPAKVIPLPSMDDLEMCIDVADDPISLNGCRKKGVVWVFRHPLPVIPVVWHGQGYFWKDTRRRAASLTSEESDSGSDAVPKSALKKHEETQSYDRYKHPARKKNVTFKSYTTVQLM